MTLGKNFSASFLFQAQFGQAFFFKTDVFEQNAPEATVFEENGQKQVFGFDRRVTGILSDLPGLFQAMASVMGQLLAESSFKHRVSRIVMVPSFYGFLTAAVNDRDLCVMRFALPLSAFCLSLTEFILC